MAGGGFGGNKEMLNDLLPNIARMFTQDEDFLAPFGRDGSTIQMGVWAGGHLESDISTMNFDSMTVPDYLPGPLWVDEKGQRFQNEAFAGPEINGFFMARAKRGNITSIYDSTYETQILRGFPGHQAFEYDMPAVVEAMKGNFEAARNAGAEGANGWYCADTIEQLAEYIGVEPAALTATVEQYNKVCAEGYDSDFAKDLRFLHAVAKAPFYAHVTTPSLGFALVTTGGFVTTNDQQVLNGDYQPIEGLYASGNTCGRYEVSSVCFRNTETPSTPAAAQPAQPIRKLLRFMRPVSPPLSPGRYAGSCRSAGSGPHRSCGSPPG